MLSKCLKDFYVLGQGFRLSFLAVSCVSGSKQGGAMHHVQQGSMRSIRHGMASEKVPCGDMAP